LKPAREEGWLPAFPFGTDFTPAEQRLIPALLMLQQMERAPLRLAALAWQGLARAVDAADAECLERLGLRDPGKLSEHLYRALVTAALAKSRTDT
jgi:hypothetical protein